MGEIKVTLPQCPERDFRLQRRHNELLLKKLLRTKLREVSLKRGWLDADEGYLYWRAEKKPDKEVTAKEELILIPAENKPRERFPPRAGALS